MAATGHLQLLMDWSITYFWPNVKNFHNALEQGWLTWSSAKIICGLKQFFTHLDLHSSSASLLLFSSHSQPCNKAKDHVSRSGTIPGSVAAQYYYSMCVTFLTMLFWCVPNISVQFQMCFCLWLPTALYLIQLYDFTLISLSSEVRGFSLLGVKHPMASNLHVDIWWSYL